MHRVTLFFSYREFRREAYPLAQKADAGDYEAVIKRARAIASNIPVKRWILNGLGTSLLQLDELPPGPSLTGFSFLVLLSKFLSPNPFGIRSLGSITAVVAHSGWDQQDIRLLQDGMSTTCLLKPELVPEPLERPSPVDERWHNPAYYWWWIRPANAYKTGWLDFDQITKFYYRLSNLDTNFEEVDIASIEVHPSTTRADLFKDYRRSIELLKSAMDKQVGLFYNLS